MHVGEGIVYTAVGLLLVVSAAVAVAAISYRLAVEIDDGSVDAVTKALDGLLLVFILVELLGAVRATVSERKLVAEPFLVVGIIASIKEIIVLSVKAADYVGKDDKFMHSIIEVGVLGVLVLVLAAAAIILRAKEREPQEGKDDAGRESRKDGEALKVRQGDPEGAAGG